MVRKASLHIYKKDLFEILEDVVDDPKRVTDYIMKKAKLRSINSRTVNVTTQRLENKVKKLVEATRQDASAFAQLLYLKRVKKKHKGIRQIKPGSKDWGVIKEITNKALVFNNQYTLSRREGFSIYIDIALKYMNGFSLNKILGMSERIFQLYEAQDEINNDNNKEGTKTLYRYFFSYIMDNTGIPDNSEEIPEKYLGFVRARKQADEMGVKYKDYVMAQFEGLDFIKGIPNPTQMYGEKAKQRVITYLYKHNINTKKKKENWLDTSKIFDNE